VQQGADAAQAGELWPFAVYSGLVVAAVAAILLLSHFLGERHRAPWRDTAYESGIKPTGTARLRYGIHFYPVGIFFMLFDVEALFLYTWAVAFRELGWLGYIEIALFIGVLFLGLVYIWVLGGLDWSPSRRRIELERQRPRTGDGRVAAGPRRSPE
jgi:NADH-quinone oxidoreductase subunit A